MAEVGKAKAASINHQLWERQGRHGKAGLNVEMQGGRLIGLGLTCLDLLDR